MPLADLSDIVSFRGEWQLLLEFASPLPDTSRLVGLARSVDWSRILVLAEEQGVLGHVAKRLHELDGDLVPVEIRMALLERHRAKVFATLRMTGELFRLLELFAVQDIPALVVKGPVLAIQAYGDPAMRSYGDLDLLVRQRDIRRATEMMSAAGYAAAVPLSAVDTGKIPGQYLFSKPDSKLIVELHNDRTLRYFPRRLPLEDFFARVNIEAIRKEHWDGASEYARYLAKLKANPSLNFHYPGSVEYEGSEQLIRLGLLHEDHGWMRIRTAGNDMADIEERVTLSAAGSP